MGTTVHFLSQHGTLMLFLVVLAGGVFGHVLYKAVVGRRVLGRMPRITAEELTRTLESDRAPLLIDVRGREAVEKETGVPGSLHLPLEEFERLQGMIPRGRDLVLYCACPGDVSSALAAHQLRQLGIENVRVLQGGLSAWQERAQQEIKREAVPIVSLAT